MYEFVDSASFLVLKKEGEVRLIKHRLHEDYSILHGGSVVSQCGAAMAEGYFSRAVQLIKEDGR